MSAAVIRIDVRQNKSRWPLKRAQRWSWRAVNVGNSKVMARSSENYTNRSDAETAAALLFSDGAQVRMMTLEGDVILREMTG